MPRYIDLDKAIERLNASPAFPNMGMDGYFLLGVVEDLLRKMPTADVAPKTEVEREIFEEFRSEIKEALKSNYRVRDEVEKLYHKVGGKISALRGIDDFIDELELKYTEKGGSE